MPTSQELNEIKKLKRKYDAQQRAKERAAEKKRQQTLEKINGQAYIDEQAQFWVKLILERFKEAAAQGEKEICYSAEWGGAKIENQIQKTLEEKGFTVSFKQIWVENSWDGYDHGIHYDPGHHWEQEITVSYK